MREWRYKFGLSLCPVPSRLSNHNNGYRSPIKDHWYYLNYLGICSADISIPKSVSVIPAILISDRNMCGPPILLSYKPPIDPPTKWLVFPQQGKLGEWKIKNHAKLESNYSKVNWHNTSHWFTIRSHSRNQPWPTGGRNSPKCYSSTRFLTISLSLHSERAP